MAPLRIPATKVVHPLRSYPMAVWDAVDEARALGATPAPPRHLRVGPGLVDEDELGRIKRRLRLPPLLAGLGDVFAQLLAGVRGFF